MIHVATDAGRLAAGVVVGVAVGVLIFLVPLLVVVIPLAVAVSATGLREVPADRARSAAGAGVLMGAGGVFLYGALNTFVSCQSSEDFCGHANVVPLFALGAATLALGVIVSGLTFARRR